MESEDGNVFIKNLAHFIRTHEQALASALQSSHHRSKSTVSNDDASSSTASLAHVLRRPFASLTTRSAIKPAKLSLTPHHLYFLLSKFEELGVNVGVLNVRLENIHAETTHANYVSFLGQAPKKAGRAADSESMRSVSSIRSVMSNVSSIWSSLTSSSREQKRVQQQHHDDLKYLYSCFTKLPALRLAPDPRARLIAGYEAFPFDTAVPVHILKNISYLDISDLDFRQIYGWHILSKQLRSLILKHAQLDDPLDVLVDIVLDDIDGRRRRSSKPPLPTTPSTPGGSWMTSPKFKHAELAFSSSPASSSNPTTPFTKHQPGSVGDLPRRQRSCSPPRPGSGQVAGAARRSSSQGSSVQRTASRQKSVDLVGITIVPSSAWHFLRHLSLADNGLHYVAVASLAPVAPTLQSLDLSSNLFTEIPDSLASLSQLRQLNLSNCMIESLRSLARSPLPAITTLNVRGNRLSSLAGIEKLFSLEKLDLCQNKIVDPAELARLTGIPYMSHVYVAKNRFTRTYPDHRVTIFNLFRKAPGRNDDIIIDQIAPMYSEKRKLVDWAPEAPVVAVIKPAADDEETKEGAVDPTSKQVVEISVDSPPRRNKTPRKRVVHMTSDNTTTRPSLEAQKPRPVQQDTSHTGTDNPSPPPSPPPPPPLQPLTINREMSIGSRTLG